MPATNAEYREISETYEKLRVELRDLFKVGTDRAAVNDLLAQATHDLERGDYDRARLNLAKAQSTARTSTHDFIGNLITEVRNILLSVRTVGGDISTARPMLITAKKEMNGKRYRRAATLVLGSIDAIGSLEDRYKSTLQELVRAKYNLTLVESIGLDVSAADRDMDRAFNELKARHFEAARLLAKGVRAQVRETNAGWRETSRLLTEARLAVADARDRGADVSKADSLVRAAIGKAEANGFSDAQELLRDAIELAGEASGSVGPREDAEADLASFVRRRGRTAKEAIARTKGMGADTADAEMHYAVGWKRQQDGDMEGALEFYSRAIDEAITAGKAMAWKG